MRSVLVGLTAFNEACSNVRWNSHCSTADSCQSTRRTCLASEGRALMQPSTSGGHLTHVLCALFASVIAILVCRALPCAISGLDDIARNPCSKALPWVSDSLNFFGITLNRRKIYYLSREYNLVCAVLFLGWVKGVRFTLRRR